MITLKYKKEGKSIYLSHIDVLRHMNRTMRRAGIDVDFSQGFNPHMLTKLGVPLPLGMKSNAEYVTVSANVAPDEFLRKYNENCVEGMEGVQAFSVERNPNLAGKVVYAEYRIYASAENAKKELAELVNYDSFVVDYPTRKEPLKTKDIGGLIKEVEVFSDHIQIIMDAVNLRADVLASSLSRKFNFELTSNEIIRVAQYVKGNSGELINVDEFLRN